MLILKKTSTKKLKIYVAIMILMFGSTGFLLYANWQSLTTAAVPAGEITANQPSVDPLKTEQPLGVSEIRNKKFDTAIFSSEKFKNLKENVLTPQENSALGKRDPFSPN